MYQSGQEGLVGPGSNNYGKEQPVVKPQLPTAGRIVHFYPVGENEKAITGANNAEKVPAIIIQAWGYLTANMQVFTMNPDALNVLRYSVYHISEVPKDDEGNPTVSYWDWPQIK